MRKMVVGCCFWYLVPWRLRHRLRRPVVGFITGASGLGDLSFNDMTYGGIRRAQQEFDFKLVILEPGDKSGSNDSPRAS